MEFTERERIASELLAWQSRGKNNCVTAWQVLADALKMDCNEPNEVMERLASILIYDSSGHCNWFETVDDSGEDTYWTAECRGFWWDEEASYKPLFCPWCGDPIAWVDLDEQRLRSLVQHEDEEYERKAGK